MKLHVLSDLHVEPGDFRYFGCTLWTDMALRGNQEIAMAAASSGINDYRLIRNSKTYGWRMPIDTVGWRNQSVNKLREFLAESDPERSVVVTHSCPSIKSIPERFRGHALTPAFASNMENISLYQESKGP